MSCEKDDPTVIDPVLNLPTISNTLISPSLIFSDSVKSVAVATVQSVDPIGTVTVTVTDPNGLVRVFVLKDDGNLPDTVANDGKYSGYINFIMDCRLVGDYKSDFLAKTQPGLSSNIITQNFNIKNLDGLHPVISNLFVTPHDALRGQITPFIFRVNVTDPDGQCDILHVTYKGYYPLGQPLQNNYDLLDDGSCCLIPPFNSVSGDSVANDGTFTRLLAGAPDSLGYYKYFFYALDRSGDTSNILIDSIFVHN